MPLHSKKAGRGGWHKTALTNDDDVVYRYGNYYHSGIFFFYALAYVRAVSCIDRNMSGQGICFAESILRKRRKDADEESKW